MPSPVGHTLAGLALGWVAQAATRERPSTSSSGWRDTAWAALRGYPALGVALALLPDLDILLGAHRTVSHSVGGTLLVGAAAWGTALLLRRPPAVFALLCAAAFGSHTVLDWLGVDDAAPYGLMALWPFSGDFVLSGVDLFPPVSRRYWIPEQFILGNLRSALWELLTLGPIAAAAFLYRRRARAKVESRIPPFDTAHPSTRSGCGEPVEPQGGLSERKRVERPNPESRESCQP